MKDKKPFIIQITIGIVLIGTGFLIQSDYYSSLVFAMGCGLAFSSIVQLLRISYWQAPKRQAEYSARKQEAHINSIDERKQYIRMKAGHVTYQIMAWTLITLAFILTLFHVSAWIIAMLFLLFIFQWIIGMIVYNILERRI